MGWDRGLWDLRGEWFCGQCAASGCPVVVGRQETPAASWCSLWDWSAKAWFCFCSPHLDKRQSWIFVRHPGWKFQRVLLNNMPLLWINTQELSRIQPPPAELALSCCLQGLKQTTDIFKNTEHRGCEERHTGCWGIMVAASIWNCNFGKNYPDQTSAEQRRKA